jgi:hypothetical protein
MRIFVLVLCVLLATVFTVKAEDVSRPIGLVKTVTGDAFIQRNGRNIATKPGSPLLQGDVLVTGAKSTMGVILSDDTILSMGSSTETRLEQFAFEPVEHKMGMVVRVVKGVIGYLSGRISKMAPGTVRIETPVATLGVRGTYLFARIVP